MTFLRSNRWLWLLLALVVYYLPWVYHRSAGLTFNANDLAEWNTLALRAIAAPFTAPLLLRIVLAFLALLYGLYTAGAKSDLGRWGFAVLAIILAITLLPPADFFKGAWDDANYQQQFGIAIGTTIGLVVIAVLRWRSLLARYQRRLEIALAVLTMICAVIGNVLALNIVRAYQIDVTLGGGMFVLVICMGLYLLSLFNREV